MAKRGRSKSKWNKYRIVRSVSSLRSHIPKSKPYSKVNLKRLLARYGRVIVKPVHGSGGKGVMRVRGSSSGRIEIRYKRKKKTYSSRSAANRYIRRKSKGKGLLVQRYIRLARVQGRPFDLRVMVQRKKTSSSRWKITGRLAKVAGKGYIITNVRRSHGKVTKVTSALRRSNLKGNTAARRRRILKEVDRISLVSAKVLSRHYRYIHTVGMDIGIDRDGKVWLIEANFTPSLSLFRKLSEKAYRKIVNYRK
ncbi:YheC/YheD family protein [Paenibacillus sp.]|uniref:YheC/YheD family protein n=1 Tax=Paenibacillus sp. TaxID=58172 RepID=UPI0028111A2F|nr:YheC/YheD family protein [Paenibacillus sp.]